MASKELLSSKSDNDSDNDAPRQRSIVTNIFGKKIVINPLKIRERPKFFGLKLKIYCALHRPSGSAKLYHYILLAIIFCSTLPLNVIDEPPRYDKISDTNITVIKMSIDSVLIIILTVELLLRLWSCDVIFQFRGWTGRLKYLMKHAFMRTLDVFGIIVFVAFILNRFHWKDGNLDSNLRICHLTQVLQIHRIIHRLLKLLVETVLSQMHQLIIVLIFAFFALIVTSFCVYLVEKAGNTKIEHFYDALWMTFVTFTTIGYGDVVPESDRGKALLILCSSVGFIFFALPGSILGTGLALQIQEEEKRAKHHRIPAIRLIQSVWRSYASNQMSNSETHWKLYHRQDGQPLTAQDKACIRFIKSVAYLKQRRRFKIISGIANDDDFRQRSYQELGQRVDKIESDVNNVQQEIIQITDNCVVIQSLINVLKAKLKEKKRGTQTAAITSVTTVGQKPETTEETVTEEAKQVEPDNDDNESKKDKN